MRHVRITSIGLVALLAGFSSSLMGCSDLVRARARAAFQQSVGAAGIDRLNVETRNGSVEIRADAKAAGIDVRGEKWAQAPTQQEADDLLAQIQIEVAPDAAHPGLLVIAAHFPQRSDRSMGANFTANVPPALAASVHTSNGAITVAGLARDLQLHSSNGEIQVTDGGGSLQAESSNGRIVVRDVAGNVDLRSSCGAIDIERAGKDSVQATTSNGSIRALQTRGSATLTTSNGSVELHAAWLPDRPQVKATTSNGRVLVELPEDVKARLEMSTSNAGADASLEGVQVSDLHSGRSAVTATLNGGGGLVQIESSNGGVKFRALPASQPGGRR